MESQAPHDAGPVLRVVLIGGAAGIATTHLRALAQMPQMELVGMSDINAEGVKARAAEVGCAALSTTRRCCANCTPILP